MVGKVIDVCNGGTIITLYVQSRNRIYTVVFDHRCFQDFIESTVRFPLALIGHRIKVEGPLGEQIVSLA